MSPEGLLALLGSVAFVLFVGISLYIYAALVRQMAVRLPPVDGTIVRTFGVPEAILALALIFLFMAGVAAGTGQPTELSNRMFLENLLVVIAVVLFIVALLTFRGIDINLLAGFSRIGFARAVGTGLVLLMVSYPLIMLAEAITQTFLPADSSKQNIVELFSTSGAIDQRIMIIFFAVVVAPVTEEFLFRFFLYGVLKRYLGRFFGLVFNAVLFGAVHGHLPSFAPLAVFGLCLAIAYDWSGSILVSMTMHSLFNAATLTALAFPELSPQ